MSDFIVAVVTRLIVTTIIDNFINRYGFEKYIMVDLYYTYCKNCYIKLDSKKSLGYCDICHNKIMDERLKDSLYNPNPKKVLGEYFETNTSEIERKKKIDSTPFKVNVHKIIEYNKNSKSQIVEIDFKNSLGKNRRIEIKYNTWKELNLNIGKSVYVYQREDLDIKIHYKSTYELYGRVHRKYDYVKQRFV